MEKKGVELILFQCQGLGLQINESLDRLSSLVEDKELQAETAYLLDDKGEILCTLLRDKDIYESRNNQDRRILNAKNGFNIVWVHDGDGCCVFKGNKSSDKLINIRHLVACCIVSLLLGLLLGCVFDRDTEPLHSPNDVCTMDSLVSVNKSLNVQKDSLEQCIVNLNEMMAPYRETIYIDSIRKVAVSQKRELQSMECNIVTVDKVRSWWNSLSERDKTYAMKTYNFNDALRIYNQIFNARNVHDLHYLFYKDSDVLSNRQREVLRRIRKDIEVENWSLRNKDFNEIEKMMRQMDSTPKVLKQNERNI